MNFIFDVDQLDDNVHVSGLDELGDELGLDWYTAGPCYAMHVEGLGDEREEVNIHMLVRALMEWIPRDGDERVCMLACSVTEKEPRYNDWLEAVACIPEATIHVVHRKGYDCAFLCVPTVSHFNNS